ncbi:MAG: hypothetical protein O2960_22225, partial [Verrucomicrobia bacterium]|nr:hypothetical protein [Verrucomicrobiota bacterium]
MKDKPRSNSLWQRGASLNEDKPTLLTSAGEDAPTLVSLGGATLREALTSPCGTGVLQIGAVETPDCLDV